MGTRFLSLDATLRETRVGKMTVLGKAESVFSSPFHSSSGDHIERPMSGKSQESDFHSQTLGAVNDHTFNSSFGRQTWAMIAKQTLLLRRNPLQVCCSIICPLILLALVIFLAVLEARFINVDPNDDDDGPTLDQIWNCQDEFGGILDPSDPLYNFLCFSKYEAGRTINKDPTAVYADDLTSFPFGVPPTATLHWDHWAIVDPNGILGYRNPVTGVVEESGFFADRANSGNYTDQINIDGTLSTGNFDFPSPPPSFGSWVPYMTKLEAEDEVYALRSGAAAEASNAARACASLPDPTSFFSDVTEEEATAYYTCLTENFWQKNAVPNFGAVINGGDGVNTLEWDLLAPIGGRYYSSSPSNVNAGFYPACVAGGGDFFSGGSPLGGSGLCERTAGVRRVYEALLRERTGNDELHLSAGAYNLPDRDEFRSSNSPYILSDSAALFIIPIVMAFSQPLFSYEVITERAEGLREMMAVMGLRPRSYWVAQFGWNALLYYITVALVFIAAIATQMNWFLAGNPIIVALIFLVYGPATIAFAYFFAQFFKGTRMQLIVHYLFFVLVGSIVIRVLNGSSLTLAATSPWFAMMWPQYTFARQFHIFIAFLGHSNRDPINFDSRTPPDFALGFFWQIFNFFFYMGMATYLDAVWKHGKGAGRPILFPIYSLMEMFGMNPNNDSALLSAVNDDVPEKEDEDVVAERKLIESGKVSRKSPLYIRGLRKLYPGSGGSAPKLALSNFSLHMERGEVLGLLGPNGAGKSTLMNMLVGIHAPTSGEARISGYSINREMHKVRGRIGVVQQFDVLFNKLTCIEHCLFYCRVQGIKASEERKVSEKALSLVGLQGAMNVFAMNLSGGMRRRLSIAITMCGDPKLIFMDEPTTGLDPGSRRALWDIVKTLAVGRSIMLSTHMMDEAEALSDRVAIMVKGRLVALGTAQRLKKKFGDGYNLGISFAQGGFEEANAFVMKTVPNATLVSDFPGVASYAIPAPLVLSRIFKTFESERGKSGIRSWGINQASLEDVFLNIVTDSDLDGAGPGAGPAQGPSNPYGGGSPV